MSIDVIFLGLDGVLFDTEALHLQACNTAFSNAGLSVRWNPRALRTAAATHGYARAVGAALPPQILARDKKRVAELAEDKHREFHRAIAETPPEPLPAALALIDDATAAGCKICVLSDLPAPATSALLSNTFGADVNSLFTVVTGGANFDAPAGTGPYARALHAMGVEPSHAVAIDAVVPALQAAEEAGLWSVSVAPAGVDVVRPQQSLTFDALHELRSSPYTQVQQRHAAEQYEMAA